MAFTSDFFTANRNRLRQTSGSEFIIIASNGLMQRSADTTYKFSQDANFWYLTGIDEPDVLLVMDGDREYLIVPGRSVSRQAFDGAVSDEELTEISGIDNIYDDSEGWELIEKKLKKTKHVGVLGAPDSYIKDHGIYTNPARKRLLRRLHKIDSEVSLNGLNDYLRDLRVIKQPVEIDAIQRAIDITINSLNNAQNNLEKYNYEYEIEADLTRGIRAQGSSGHAYEPIVASGERACTLHYVENNAQLKDHKFIVIDVGAEVDHYAADITRTFCKGKLTKRMEQVYSATLDVHNYACSILRPGVLMREFEHDVRAYLGDKLIDLGLIKEASQEEIMKYYPHSTSHFLGLNVHDVGNYDDPLAEGMVITVEPGIYIPEEGIGVRLEDDVLVTATGIKNLSQKLPK